MPVVIWWQVLYWLWWISGILYKWWWFISCKPWYYLHAHKDTQHNREPTTVQKCWYLEHLSAKGPLFYADPLNSWSYIRQVLTVALQYSPTILLQFHHFLSITICHITSVYTHMLQCNEYQRNPTLFLLLLSTNILLTQMCTRLNDLCW